MTSLSQRARPDASPQLVLVIVCAGVILASLDLFIVNVALPQIARDFHVHNGLADLSWVLNAYAIVYASLLVLFGRLADRYRREHGFLLGVAVFVAASAACSAASSVAMLVAFRVVQAAGAALLTPTSLGLILATTPEQRRHSAVRIWASVGGIAGATGPAVGGLLVGASWRWVFLVNVPIGVIALIVGWRRLPRVPGHAVKSPSGLGASLITAGVGILTLGLVKGSAWGWGSTETLAVLAGAAVVLTLSALHALYSRNPLVDRDLFRLRPFRGASAAVLLFSIAFGAMILSMILWEQDVWGWSPLQSGLAVTPGPAMVPIFSILAGRLIPRIGSGAVIAIGTTLLAAGTAYWALAVGLHHNYAGEILPGQFLTGSGVGFALPTLLATGSASLPAHSFATGSAVVNMLRQIGIAIGIAILIAFIGSPHTPAAALAAYHRGWEFTTGVALLGGLTALVLLSSRRTVVVRAPEAVAAAGQAS